MYDIAIIGAGPAGATLARLVSERFKTLVVDRRHMTADSGRPGGFADRYRAATRELSRDIFIKGFKRRLIYTPAIRRLCMRIRLGALPACAGAHGPLPDPKARLS